MYLTAFNVFKVPPFQALLTQYLWSNCLNQPLFQELPSLWDFLHGLFVFTSVVLIWIRKSMK